VYMYGEVRDPRDPLCVIRPAQEWKCGVVSYPYTLYI
jgi:hypothetical protein